MDKIVEFLRSDMVLNILALLPQRNALRVEELSLFERFAALCDGLPHLDGNECAGAFLGYLGDALRCSVTPENLCTRDQQKSAWRALAEHNRAPQLTCESFCFPDVQRCSIDCEDIASHIKNARTDELEQVSCELSKKSELCIDLDGFCYTRPDEYHATLTYSRVLRGENVQSGEFSALVAWVLCRTLMKSSAELYIKLGDSLSEARGLLDLLEQRKLSPKITLISRENTDARKLAELCLRAPSKNIYVATADKATYKELCRYLPTNRIFLI
jgi:hypothetical protein